MKKGLVYDLPTRVFHWMFFALFVLALSIAKFIEADSVIYAYHMIAGLTLCFLIVLRVVWGFFGTRYAKFESFPLKPRELLQYLKTVISGEKKIWAGHNPASSWAAVIMMTLGLGMGVTGVLMASGGNKEVLEEIHELIANLFLVVAGLHVCGILLHTLRFKEMIGLSMVTGLKENIKEEDTIPIPRVGLGIIFIALTVAFAIHLLKNYDSATRKLNLFVGTLQLGELEDGARNERE